MRDVLSYKGYVTRIHYEDGVLFGKLEGIRDLVNFESDSVQTVEKEFHDAVDAYLEMCERHGDEPERPFKGVFNVRIPADLHRQLYSLAVRESITLNRVMEQAAMEYVQRHA